VNVSHGGITRNLPQTPAHAAATPRLLFSHELDAMLVYLPEVEMKLKSLEAIERRSVWEPFREVCEQWTVYARYSTKQAKKPEAEQFVQTVKEVKQWLKEL
jgi:hypothetical protein